MTTFKPGDKVTWGDDDVVYEVWSKHSKPGWLWLTREGRSRPIEARARNLTLVRAASVAPAIAPAKPLPTRTVPRPPRKVTADDWARIDAAIKGDAADHGGTIDPNRVRATLSGPDGLVVPSQALSARYSQLAALEEIESLGYIGVNDDTRSGNAGKPQRHWRWIGPPLEAAS